METTGLEPVITLCKSAVLPIKPCPLIALKLIIILVKHICMKISKAVNIRKKYIYYVYIRKRT